MQRDLHIVNVSSISTKCSNTSSGGTPNTPFHIKYWYIPFPYQILVYSLSISNIGIFPFHIKYWYIPFPYQILVYSLSLLFVQEVFYFGGKEYLNNVNVDSYKYSNLWWIERSKVTGPLNYKRYVIVQ